MTNEVTVTVGTWSGDQNQTLRLLNWIAELGRVNAPFLLICSKHCEVDKLMSAAKLAFSSARWEEDREITMSDWSSQKEGPKNAAGPNSMWRMAAWYFHLPELKGPWMWLEPDVIPLCRDWYDVMVAEYRQAQKPFYGALVKSPNSEDTHMSGCGIYDPRTPAIMTTAMRKTEPYDVAFDVADAAKVLANAYTTTRIHDHYRAPAFTGMADYNARVRPEAVLWHSDKTGSLLPILRQKLGLPQKEGDASWSTNANSAGTGTACLSPVIVSKGAPTFHPEAAPVVDIYLKTWPRDYQLASYCLRSISKFVKGFRNILLECPESTKSSRTVFYDSDELIVPIELSVCTLLKTSVDQKPGYLWQQKQKLESYKLSDAQYFLWVDSDCCFNRPVDVSEFFVNGKSKWRFTPLNLARPDQSSTWVPVMRKFLGIEPTEEYMREHPTMVPRWLMEEMEKFCLYKHGMALGDYIMAQSTGGETDLVFSEINCAGFFARTFHRDKFEWVTDDQATPCLVQGHTWAGPERIQQDIDRAKEILGLNEPEVPPNLVRGWDTPGDEVEFWPEPEPLTTASAIAFLVEQAQKDGFAKGRILKQLKAAGLVKGGKLAGVTNRMRVKAEEQAYLDQPLVPITAAKS